MVRLQGNFDHRNFIGMVLIMIGGGVLSWEQRPEFGVPCGTIAIVSACLCWAIDNNLTRKISASDAVQIAGVKGLAAGVVNLTIGLAFGMSMPAVSSAVLAGIVGLCGYGLGLVFSSWPCTIWERP
jgi:hypothetical protein